MLRQMTTRQLINLFILTVVLYSCADKPSTQDKTTEPNKYFGVQIKNHLPTGSIFIDSSGQRLGYRSIVADITNDTLVPINLQIEFPNKHIDLYPSTNNTCKVFLLPDSMTREKEYDYNDSLTKGLKLAIDEGIYESLTLKKVIKPGETYKLRLGFLISPDGLTRAEIFSNGHKHNLAIPDSAIKFSVNKSGIDLLLGVTLFNDYSTISCGQISFSN